MENKKVFIVMNRLGGQGWGGAHRVAVILANYLAKRKYDVSIIVWNKIRIDYPINSNVKIIDLKIEQKNEMDRIKACLETRKVLSKNKGSYVYVLTSRLAVDILLSSAFLGVHIIASERTDPNREPKSGFFRFVRNHMFKYMYKTVYQTIDAKDYFPPKAQAKGVVIPNPISPELPKPYSGIRKKEFITFCRIDKQKNLPMMIDAFIDSHKKHPDFCLSIYGEGLIQKEITEYIKDKNAESYIFMKGFCSPIHGKIIDCYAYLSSSNYEGLSNSMLEAMAIGLPCICTDCPIGRS